MRWESRRGRRHIPLRAAQRHADNIRFLEGVRTAHIAGDLPGDTHDGVLSIMASAKPVMKLVAPGPDVAIQTPTRPVARA